MSCFYENTCLEKSICNLYINMLVLYYTKKGKDIFVT